MHKKKISLQASDKYCVNNLPWQKENNIKKYITRPEQGIMAIVPLVRCDAAIDLHEANIIHTAKINNYHDSK